MPSGSPEIVPSPALTLPPTDADPAEAWLVLPGLNLHPDRLGPAAGWCTAAGAAVVRPRLTGYAAPGDPARKSVQAQHWLADLDDAWNRTQSRLPAASPALLGYSLGGLLGLVWAVSRGVRLRRAILLAPALRLKAGHRAVLQMLGSVLPGRLCVPSLSPAAYRMHATTPVAAYRALADLECRLRPHLERWLQGGDAGLPPMLVACSLRDELVDTRPLVGLAQAQSARVTLVPLSHTPPRGYPRHLGLDGRTLGEAEWGRLSSTVAEWLRRTRPDADPGPQTAPSTLGAP